MKIILKLFLFFICSCAFSQTNLLDTSSWTVGTGSVEGFGKTGDAEESVREFGVDPFGESSILWRTENDAASDGDGGYTTSFLNADHTKKYRFSIWLKKTNSNDGYTYFGPYTYDDNDSRITLKLAGTSTTNPYFFSGDLPQLGEWFLLVGFLHESSYTGTVSQGAIYNTSGVQVASLSDYKFPTTATRIRQRSYLYYDTNILDVQYHYDPRIYIVNDQEPTVEELLNPNNTPVSSGETVWNINGSSINYTTGNVAVGTTTIPTGYKLAVDGKVIAEEVKVAISSTWPDYVFNDNYKLTPLKEIQDYINKNGHLPNIPSAKEVEENGIELGEMNKLLLEKIEELTLYLIQERDYRKNQELKIEQLQQRVIKLEYKN